MFDPEVNWLIGIMSLEKISSSPAIATTLSMLTDTLKSPRIEKSKSQSRKKQQKLTYLLFLLNRSIVVDRKRLMKAQVEKWRKKMKIKIKIKMKLPWLGCITNDTVMGSHYPEVKKIKND